MVAIFSIILNIFVKFKIFFDIRETVLTGKILFPSFIGLLFFFISMLFVTQNKNRTLELNNKTILVQTQLIAHIISTQMITENDIKISSEIFTKSVNQIIDKIIPNGDVDIYVYSQMSELIFEKNSRNQLNLHANQDEANIGFFDKVRRFLYRFGRRFGPKNNKEFSLQIAKEALNGQKEVKSTKSQDGYFMFAAGLPLTRNELIIGAIVLAIPIGILEKSLADNRHTIFVLFIFTTILTLILSHIAALNIARPLSDLAKTAEMGKLTELSNEYTEQRLEPYFSERRDAIGRLSQAMYEMIIALYDRINTNENFAADIMHEIKNPLASMRSAIETLKYTRNAKQHNQLLNIMRTDVQRLDRMISDISNASRLDGELINEETELFDITAMLQQITAFLSIEAKEKNIEIIWSPPVKAIMFNGLEERLAQVFVNLITNAISFCEAGDAIRVWVRIRKSQILIVVEDSGCGIPKESLKNIFHRFYSQRPNENLGSHSELGLAISKQIVEAHCGTIWV